MFTLTYGFYKYCTQREEYCVLILGIDNAGKTVSTNWCAPELLSNPNKMKFNYRHTWKQLKQNVTVTIKLWALIK